MSILETPTADYADELIDRISEIKGALRAQAAENERLGKLSDATVALLRGAGLLDAMQPSEMGGSGLSPYDALRVYEALASVDVPAQWVSMVPGSYSHILSFMEEAGVKEMAKDGAPLMAGQFAPTGQAESAPGGYRITGKWSYGSGIHHARHAVGVAMVTVDGEAELDEDGQRKAIVWCAAVEDVNLGENWNALGLRATGSVDYRLDDVFIPQMLTIPLECIMAPNLNGATQSALTGQVGWATLFHSAAALGAGRRVLEELVKFASAPSSRGPRLADDPTFRRDYAKMEANYRSARAYLYASWAEQQHALNRGEPTARQVMTDIKASTLHLHDVNIDIATMAFRIGGGASLRSGDFQRAYTDVMTMGQHIQVAQGVYAECAKDFLGEAAGLKWGYFTLE